MSLDSYFKKCPRCEKTPTIAKGRSVFFGFCNGCHLGTKKIYSSLISLCEDWNKLVRREKWQMFKEKVKRIFKK